MAWQSRSSWHGRKERTRWFDWSDRTTGDMEATSGQSTHAEYRAAFEATQRSAEQPALDVADHAQPPTLPEPEHVPMMWSSFAQRVERKYGKQIMSCRCFHTGTTHTVRKSTIRTTISGNRALVMMDDREQYFIAISKGIGCDAMKVFDPSFLGWI